MWLMWFLTVLTTLCMTEREYERLHFIGGHGVADRWNLRDVSSGADRPDMPGIDANYTIKIFSRSKLLW